jgi:hypothetical protein
MDLRTLLPIVTTGQNRVSTQVRVRPESYSDTYPLPQPCIELRLRVVFKFHRHSKVLANLLLFSPAAKTARNEVVFTAICGGIAPKSLCRSLQGVAIPSIGSGFQPTFESVRDVGRVTSLSSSRSRSAIARSRAMASSQAARRSASHAAVTRRLQIKASATVRFSGDSSESPNICKPFGNFS